MIIDRQRLMADIMKSKEASEDWNSGEYHQAILDVCYEAWNLKENEAWDYKDLINHARFTYGEFAEFIVLAGKTNQQVTNNGFDGYFQNGYADGVGGCFANHTTAPLHRRLIKLMKMFNLNKTELGIKALEIMESVERIFMRETKHKDDEYTEIYQDVYDKYDKEYFNIDEQLMKYLNQFVKDTMSGKDALAA